MPTQQIGIVTVSGQTVGSVTWSRGAVLDPFNPALDGYEPLGRAESGTQIETPLGGPEKAPPARHRPGGSHHRGTPGEAQPGHSAAPSEPQRHHAPLPKERPAPPSGNSYDGGSIGGAPVQKGSRETDQSIQDASKAYGLDPNFMRSVASIESGMNPQSNAHKSTQYKGLYQIGHDEWNRFGGQGNIYSARDNAFAAAHMFDTNKKMFHQKFGRDPTDTEMYLMHQQGLGFYTRGAMTNISGNPYPGMHGGQSHNSFEAGWGKEVARRKAGFASKDQTKQVAFDPETQPL